MTPEMIGYVAMVLMGVSLGMLGSGGSLFIMPILVYFFAQDAESATTHALLIIGLAALIGGIRSALNGSVHVKTIFFFAIPSSLGIVIARHFVLPWLPEPILNLGFFVLTKNTLIMLFFSVFMLIASFSLFSSRILRAEHHSRFPPFFILMFQGVLVGFTTGFAGIAGGFMIIPVLVHLVDLPLSTAVGTSLFIIAANALFGFSISYMNEAPMDWTLSGSLLSAAIVGLIVGFFLSKIILEDVLKKAFAVLVFVVGACVLGDHLIALFSHV